MDRVTIRSDPLRFLNAGEEAQTNGAALELCYRNHTREARRPVTASERHSEHSRVAAVFLTGSV